MKIARRFYFYLTICPSYKTLVLGTQWNQRRRLQLSPCSSTSFLMVVSIAVDNLSLEEKKPKIQITLAEFGKNTEVVDRIWSQPNEKDYIRWRPCVALRSSSSSHHSRGVLDSVTGERYAPPFSLRILRRKCQQRKTRNNKKLKGKHKRNKGKI